MTINVIYLKMKFTLSHMVIIKSQKTKTNKRYLIDDGIHKLPHGHYKDP